MRDAVVHQIAAERAALLAFLQEVGEDDWSRTTVCAPWSVKDVLAHVVEGEVTVGKVYRHELAEAGYLDPEDGIARWRSVEGTDVRDAFGKHGLATQVALDQMTDATWRAPIKILGCREIRQLVRLHLFDLAVHGHDLTDALGAKPVWGPRLPFLVEFVVRAAPLTLHRHGLEPQGALGIHVGDRSWTIDGGTGRWQLADCETPASVTAEPEDLVLYTTGRRARAETSFKIEGDTEIAERILSAWQVLAEPPKRP